MKNSLITLSFFLLGCVAGFYTLLDFDAHQASVYVLYLLMLLLGINLGGTRDPKQFVESLKPQTLLIPLATVGGTFLFSALGAFILSQWTGYDCIATELGTIALLSNIFREMTALICAPIFRKYFGYFAPISAAGIGSADISLPAIARYSGPEAIPVAIIHGLLIEISVPFFVSFFCQL